MLSERSLLLSGYINSNTIDSGKSNTPPLPEVPLHVQATGLKITPTTTATAAYLYLEKVKNERMSPRVTAAQIDSLKDVVMESSAAVAATAAMINNNNNISINSNNNNSNHNNGNSTSNCSGSASNGNNSCTSRSNNLVINQIGNNSMNNTSYELHSHSVIQSSNQPQQQQHQFPKQTYHFHHQQQQLLSLNMNTNHVKKERLSPGPNGDFQTSFTGS